MSQVQALAREVSIAADTLSAGIETLAKRADAAGIGPELRLLEGLAKRLCEVVDALEDALSKGQI